MAEEILRARVQGGTVALLSDDDGLFVRWRDKRVGPIIERLDPPGIIELRNFLNSLDIDEPLDSER